MTLPIVVTTGQSPKVTVVGGVAAATGTSLVDNMDGTLALTGTGVVDDLDGTYTVTALDNGDGTYTVASLTFPIYVTGRSW